MAQQLTLARCWSPNLPLSVSPRLHPAAATRASRRLPTRRSLLTGGGRCRTCGVTCWPRRGSWWRASPSRPPHGSRPWKSQCSPTPPPHLRVPSCVCASKPAFLHYPTFGAAVGIRSTCKLCCPPLIMSKKALRDIIDGSFCCSSMDLWSEML